MAFAAPAYGYGGVTTVGISHQVPRGAELRAVALAIRRHATAGQPWGDRDRDADTDGELLAALREPFASVDDVRDRLDRVERHLRERGDRRSVFLTVYTEMTAHVAAGIAAGAFEDPTWVREYLVTFADWYRRALVAFERGDHVPRPWRLAFDAPSSDATLLVQDALLGINAHINYDLAHALRAVGIDPARDAKRRDHDRIDAVLRQLVDVVQRALADVYDAAGYAHADAALGAFDERFTLVGLTEARDLAWRNAVLLTDARSGLVRRVVDWRVTAVATGAGYFVLAPGVDRAVLAALRRAEAGDPPLDPLRAAFDRRAAETTIRVP